MNTKPKFMSSVLVLVTLGLLGSTVACKSKPAEGPAEKAGKKVDQVAEDAKDAVKKKP